MSKRDFILIARAIQRALLSPEDRREMARTMADALASANPRFDRETFIQACEPAEPNNPNKR